MEILLRQRHVPRISDFVACEADEDVKYISEYTGVDHLIIGSDYGHQDPSEERQLVAAMRAREDIPSALTDKIFFDNPKLPIRSTSAVVKFIALGS